MFQHVKKENVYIPAMYQFGFFGLTPAKTHKFKNCWLRIKRDISLKLLSLHGKDLIKMMKNITILIQGQNKELNIE